MISNLLHRRGFFRRYILPKTLYGRFIALIIIPVLMVQAITLWVFYDRHWQHTTIHMSLNIMRDINAVVQRFDTNSAEAHKLSKDLGVVFVHKSTPWIGETRESNDVTGAFFMARYNNQPIYDFKGVLRFSPPHSVRFVLYNKDRHFIFWFNEYRLYSNTTANLVWYWTIGIGLIFSILALIIARNQARPIKKLSRALIAYSQGDTSAVDKIEVRGSNEIRTAIYNFKIMAGRLTRQHKRRTDMLSGISHDLRTPLTRMKLMLAMKNNNTQAMKDNIKDMEQLIDAYLSFAKGEKEQVPQLLHLHSELQKITDKWVMTGHNVTLSLDDKISSKLRIVSIHRMFENIITNALKFGDTVEIKLFKKDNKAYITITDNGCGIPQEKLEEVFSPFVRVDESRNTNTGGMGLGLTVSLDIATTHGGTITLYNRKVGTGLVAEIILPISIDT